MMDHSWYTESLRKSPCQQKWYSFVMRFPPANKTKVGIPYRDNETCCPSNLYNSTIHRAPIHSSASTAPSVWVFTHSFLFPLHRFSLQVILCIILPMMISYYYQRKCFLVGYCTMPGYIHTTFSNGIFQKQASLPTVIITNHRTWFSSLIL